MIGAAMLGRMFAGAKGRVFILVCLAFFISYIDRVNISVAAPLIQKEMSLSNTQLGVALSAFGLCYALFQIVNGFLGDYFGPRRMLAALSLLWSLGTMLTGFASGLVTLVAARTLVGLGEAGSIPTSTRAMSNWVSAQDRGFAAGFTHTAARLAAAATPPLILAMIPLVGWRGAFVTLGVLSLIWVAAWFFYFRDDPRDHDGVTPAELATLQPYGAGAAAADVPWRKLIPRILPVTMVFFCHAWTLWLYLTWLPTFFVGAYHIDIKNSALFTSGVFFAGMIGDTVGGLLTDAIYRRTGDLNKARRNAIIVGFVGSVAFMSASLFARDVVSVALCLAAALFFLEMTEGPVWATPMDIAPRYAGVAGGFISTAAGLAALFSPFAFGYITDLTGSYTPPFVVSLGFLALGVVLAFFVRADRGVEDGPRRVERAEVGA